MYKILSGILCFCSLSCFAQKKEDVRFAGLDTVFSRVLTEWKAAGFAVAVVEKDRVVYARGFGYEDYDKKKPVTTNTQFAVGSCTKAFTAALLGVLRKEGLVSLDKPVRDYLPDLRFFTDELTNKATLRDMMSHRTGLPRHDNSWYLWQSNNTDSLIGRIRYLEPSAELRERYQYNNWMYFLQGAVVEKRTGKSWAENMRSRLLDPLEMNNTNVTLHERMQYPHASKGYGLLRDSVINEIDFYNIDGVGAAGSMNSTVLDMAKWVTVWINDGKYKGKEIVPAEYIQEAKSAQMVASAALPGKDNPDLFFNSYGLGWAMVSYRGHYRVEHGGNIDGFSANTSFYPSDSIGVIVLSNQDASALPGVVRNIMADRMLGLPRKDWQTIQKNYRDKSRQESKNAQKSIVSDKKPGTHPSHPLSSYEGNYNHPGYGTISVAVKEDSLIAQAGFYKMWLRHYHYDLFEGIEINKRTGIDTSSNGFKMMFQMNEAGDIHSIKVAMEPLAKPLEFIRQPKQSTIEKDSLSQYTGKYDLGSIDADVFLKGDSSLRLYVPGQPEYELVPSEKDVFIIGQLTGFTIQFVRDSKGAVTALISRQPNGSFRAEKKAAKK